MTDRRAPAEAYLAALAGFNAMTASRFRHLLAHRSPAEAYAVAAGTHAPPRPITAAFAKYPDLAATWRASAAERHPEACWQAALDSGVSIVTPSDPRFPAQLIDDPRCPPVLFVRGDLAALDSRRVGIVGTRNATPAGRSTAAKLGNELSDAGVVVVSGLALGIDAAAHRGAVAVSESRPVGVVGCGLDRPYPKKNADLWNAVAERGLLISEWPVGTAPDAFRFPLRNRILAAIVEVLVVVESRETGGSLITAREAALRGVEVMAVPGSVHSRASVGTNALLRDGAAPVSETDDVLVALGLDHRRAGRQRIDVRPRLNPAEADLVAACRTEPRTIDALMLGAAMSLGEMAMTLARLEAAGWLVELDGWFCAADEWTHLA